MLCWITSAHPAEALAELKSPFIRCQENKFTLLHFFADRGCPDQVLLQVLDSGIPVDARDWRGFTALLYACHSGRLSLCKLLVARGANLELKDEYENTPFMVSTKSGNPELVIWLLKQLETSRLQWDSYYFGLLMEKTPDAALAYLDKFAANRGSGRRGYIEIEYIDLRLLYGDPYEDFEETALALAVKFASVKNVLTHRAMRYIIDAKWTLLRSYFFRELCVFTGLLASYYTTIFMGSPDWIELKDPSDYGIMVLRVFAWFCCSYLVVVVELSEFRAGNYFDSYWNWLNMTSYGAIMASIPLEFIGRLTSAARDGLLALITVSLWLNLLQYLCMHKKIGLLIATMGRMIRDVGQFLVLYSIFLLGFSGALYLVLHGSDGYGNVVDTFITVLLMLFGNLTYDPYNKAAGWKWAVANLLLLVYLICVVIMLLNVLIAMMSTSFSEIKEAAEEQYWLQKSEIILRIERSLPRSVRSRQYKTLFPQSDDVTDYVAAKSTEVGVDSKSIDLQATDNRIQPLGEFEAIPNPTDAAITKKRVKLSSELMVLEDGVRKERRHGRKKPLSPEMEARFQSLQASVNEDMATQIRTLTATIAELHKQQDVLKSTFCEKLADMDSNIKKTIEDAAAK